MERVYYLLKLEISSLLCEKDFLITSLDEINVLILKNQREEETRTVQTNYKRSRGSTVESESKKVSLKREKGDIQGSEQTKTIPDVFEDTVDYMLFT